MRKRKNILSQMFDVRPVNTDGSLDLEKIKKLRRTLLLNKKRFSAGEPYAKPKTSPKNALRLTDIVKPKIFFGSENKPEKTRINRDFLRPQPEKGSRIPAWHSPQETELKADYPPLIETFEEKLQKSEPPFDRLKRRKKSNLKKISELFSAKKIPSFRKFRYHENIFRQSAAPAMKFRQGLSFAAVLLVFSFLIPALVWMQKSLDIKTSVISNSERALGQLAKAKENLSNSQFDQAAVDFSQSYEILSETNRDISKIGGNFSDILRFIPGISRLASANYMISAGEHLSLAGKNLTQSANSIKKIGNPFEENQNEQFSLTDLFLNLRDGVQSARSELSACEDDINKVNMDDLPDEARDEFAQLKQKLPAANASLKNFLDYSQIFLDVLGYNGPRKYLFLFENNQEMRATGGFIGSYGILDISNGRVKKLFVDDIYNPDGQLKARVIPPAPIQKMSAVWTMHDANWFPDFPTSAEKVSWFYEKTGGPTVDGVIAITPELLRDLLEISGPIDMPEYDMSIDAENFIENTQYEVEIDFDREQNQPKKLIADLTPKILDKVMETKGLLPMMKTLKAFDKALLEKHLLLYSRNYNIQKLISGQKWSGEILNTNKDYLAVINTNINGYKTDGVIDETIDHYSDIQSDGSIVDTVSITRKHNGGNENFDWWNKVNGDWMRVYVPKGAKLLEASGQTREFVSPALDYDSLGFRKDPQVQTEDDSARFDEQSGTKIYEENDKTVFANWVYVSPGESVTITYKYILPFILSFDSLHHPADSFSILYQKQSGSLGSNLTSQIKLPDDLKTIWHWPDNVKQSGNSLDMKTKLIMDKFVGLAVEK